MKSAVIIVLLLALQGLHADPDDGKPDDDIPAAELQPLQVANDGEVLMRLRRAVSNWNQTVGMLSGFKGWDPMFGDPCGNGKNKWWTGVTCFQGRIDRM